MKPPEPSEQTLFDAARQIADPVARAAYLDTACAGNPELRVRLENLLKAEQRADEFLASDPLGLGETLRQGQIQLSEGPGTVIDKYKLLEKLGEGGFGVVYMAEQKQPVKRRVALKIIKVGMDTREVVARFEAERQALALMEHPNIAKVLDGGATDTGRPYFVMELVRGTQITEYCDEKNLSTKERLDLFIQVCQAVQHAHQKGIIHRDLKPSNILVTVNDGVAVPQIIDFGIAKATQMELTEKTVFTRFQQFIGTPAYMSPEQAELSSVDIDTRSDIYSLGVLLYELLTGKTPFDAKELLKAGVDEMRRTIREKEPERPSTRVSTLSLDELTTTAKRRGLDAPKLANVLRGDLDWIVMKCLEKDRARRYETADGLARDLQRHLNNELVLACPPSRLYRLQKVIRRNRGAFAAAAVMLGLLVGGAGLSTWEAIRARQAERVQSRLRQEAEANQKQATAEAMRSDAMANFLGATLSAAAPAQAKGRDTTVVKEILDNAVERLSELTNQPEVELELRGVMVTTYDELGLFKEAETIADQSLKLARSRFSAESAPISLALYQMAQALLGVSKLKEAEVAARESVRMRRKLLAADGISLSNAPAWQANSPNLHMAGRVDPADLYVVLSVLGRCLEIAGNSHEAVETFREALAWARKIYGNEHRDTATQLSGLGLALKDEGKLTEAEQALRESLAIYRKLYAGKAHPDIGVVLNNLALVLDHKGRLSEAESLYRESLDMARQLQPPQSELAIPTYNLARVIQSQGRLADAERLHRDAIDMLRKAGSQESFLSVALPSLAGILRDQGKLEEAYEAAAEGLALRRNLFGDADVRTVFALATLGTILQRQGKPEEAQALYRQAISINEKGSPDDWRLFYARSLLGESLQSQKKYDEAEALVVGGCEGIRKRVNKVPDAAIRLREASERVVRFYEETGQPDKASVWKKKMAEFDSAQETRKTGQ